MHIIQRALYNSKLYKHTNISHIYFIFTCPIFFLNLAVDFTYTILKHASVIIIIIISFKTKIKTKLFIYVGLYRSLVTYILVYRPWSS